MLQRGVTMIGTSAAATFSCTGCGAPHEWQPAFVGKLARCPCGRVLRVPDSPQWVRPQDLDPLQVLRQEGFDAPEPVDEPADAQPIAPPAPRPSALRDVHLPVILLAIGTMGILLQAVELSERHGDSLAGHLTLAVLDNLIHASLAAGMILALSAVMCFSLGKVQAALLRLVALAVAPWGIGLLVGAGLGTGLPGAMAVWTAAAGVGWPMAHLFFRLAPKHAAACLAGILLIRLATMWILGAWRVL